MKERNLPDFSRVDGTIGKEARERLEAKTVVIIGLGSLGSEIARLLSMTGVGNFILIDPEILDSVNIPRHAAGLPEIGKYKADAIKRLIQNEKNPAAKVQAITKDARETAHVFGGDLAVISGLGSNLLQAEIANRLRMLNIPVLAAGVYDRGEGGEIFTIKPNLGPCYSCFSTFLSRDSSGEFDLRLDSREVSVPYNIPPDQVAAVPALAIDINRIATIAADFSIKLLLGHHLQEDANKNLVIFANKRIVIGSNSRTGTDVTLGPLSSRWFSVAKNPSCLICSLPSSPRKTLFKDLLER